MAGKVWVTTKLRNCDQGYDSTMVAFDRSRSNLGVDVVDMYLIHWPFAAAGFFKETWRALLKLRDEGAVRVPGVSNFLPQHLRALIEDSGETPAVNQTRGPSSVQPAGKPCVLRGERRGRRGIQPARPRKGHRIRARRRRGEGA